MVCSRYLTGNWSVFPGAGGHDPLSSTFGFLRDVVGYLRRDTTDLRASVEHVLRRLLEAA
ncbi:MULTISPECIES: hypothetical protein [Micromonospora]|uniref:hypothetical protein n=1 Tax=Micromonospora TaxID=1873 RepID=UPI000DEBD195|nr:hypothetical protein [Micromonospora sp. LHW51205]RBQ07135.1 hypothetical protein DQE82_19665 [Micromonospora sp. LHW51205]